MEIPEGITEIDFDGDGTKEIIVKAWRGNFNAHGFYMISVYKEDGGRLLLIPNHDNPIFRTLHTADCTARDYFFLKQSNNIHLIEVMPQNSQTRFFVSGLFENKQGIPGWAEWYFEPLHTHSSNKKYCNLLEALNENKEHL